MTADLSMRVEDATRLVASLSRHLGIERAAAELRIGPADLRLLAAGDVSRTGLGPTLQARVEGWVRANSSALFSAAGRPVPPFDHLAEFWQNFYEGPREPTQAPELVRPLETIDFLGFKLNFPFGVPACALTPHSSFVSYFARRGFDLLTYKTVRDRPWHAHPFPQWAFALDAPVPLRRDEFDQPIQATLDPGADRRSLVNSFGVPSLKPNEWQADVAATKAALGRGQVLVVSVMGTPEEAQDDKDLAEQFADAAAWAVEAGADIIEANLSCPNTGDGGLICATPDASAAVLAAVAARLAPSGTPLLAKISYLAPSALRAFVESVGGYIQGIVGINTVSVPVHGAPGDDFFDGRPRAGLSGPSLLHLGLETTKRLVELRAELFASTDWVIVGVGGVSTPEDFDQYIEAGADAVQSCSGSWLNPNLAFEIQERQKGVRRIERHGLAPSLPAPIDVAMAMVLLEALDREGESAVADIALAARQGPTATRTLIDVLVDGHLAEINGSRVRITSTGKGAAAAFRRTGTIPKRTDGDGDAKLAAAEAALDRALGSIRT